ncbi:cation-translocating P-type ATPase [Hydrogenophaga soli]
MTPSDSICPPRSEHGQGLSAAEAVQRLQTDGPNTLPGSEPKSLLALVREVVTEPMFLMLLAAGGIYLVLGDRAEALFLLGFVGVVIGITLVQERRTQRAIESLRDLSAPRALVVRDGQELRVPGRDVVRGDLLVLHEGDRIAADARLLQGSLEVDESLLTGEAVPVAKNPATPDVSASTVVTRGVALAEVTATGAHTAVGRIGADLATTVEPPSGLQQSSRRMVRGLGWAAVALAVSQVGLAWWWSGRPVLDSLLSGIALAMAVLPEEIPVILTVFLALGAWRLSRQKVLTRRVTSVEALGAITVLAVDKTGTLTQNRMAVAELAVADATFTEPAAGTGPALPEAFHRLIEFAMLATPADPFDPMEKAIQRFGYDRLAGTEHVHDGRTPEQEYPLSADILAMTRVYSTAQPELHLLAAKGAPEAVADLCHLDEPHRAAWRVQVEAMAARGLRVLGVACGRWQNTQADAWPGSQHDFDFEFLGLVALADPPRPEVPDALAQCRQAGVRVIMMTGDHPATARAIARQVGLSERPDVLTGADMDALDDTHLQARLKQVDLCARLQPTHKLRLVRLLQANGEVVAMTGDGVNDAPALKAADVGVAMGQRGTDVAREAASLVLLDDSFASIVAALRQGRRIYDNITKASRFVFAVHLPIIGLTLVPTLLHWPTLLLPVHIVLLELLIDPACSVVFEDEPEDPRSMARPPRAPGESPFGWHHLVPALLQGLGVAAVLLLGCGWMMQADGTLAQVRSLGFAALVAGVMLLVLANRQPHRPVWRAWRLPNRWLGWMAAGQAALLVLAWTVPPLRDLLGLVAPGGRDAVALLVLVAVCWWWLEALRWVTRGRVG